MLDPAFVFSQQSLNDFQECPRRFYLRYVVRLAWPAAPLPGSDAARHEAHVQRGAVLHRWIERFWLGIPPQAPASTAPYEADQDLQTWWRRFADTDFSDLPAQHLPELSLVAALGAYRLLARFDLLAIEPSGRVVIVDWKTGRSPTLLDAQAMRRRLQTRVYLYTLVTAGAAYNAGLPIEPARCELWYWLANFPEQPWVRIGYSAAEYQTDHDLLLALAADAGRRTDARAFPLTDDERRCTYCAYRALCRRTGVPGSPPEDEADDPSVGLIHLEMAD